MTDKRNFFVDASSSDDEPVNQSNRNAAELRDPNGTSLTTQNSSLRRISKSTSTT